MQFHEEVAQNLSALSYRLHLEDGDKSTPTAKNIPYIPLKKELRDGCLISTSKETAPHCS